MKALENRYNVPPSVCRAILTDSLAPILLALKLNHVRRHQEWAERDLRTEEAVLRIRKRHIEVARAYQRLRLKGVKHRAAINSLFVDSRFSDLHASTSDIGHWVKLYSFQVSP